MSALLALFFPCCVHIVYSILSCFALVLHLMEKTDSPALPLLLSILLGLSACSAETTSHGSGEDKLDLSLVADNGTETSFPEANEFKRTCLSGAHLPEDAKIIATGSGWSEAGSRELEEAGLTQLRKTVLSIPGGGGRFVEEQEILSKTSSEGSMILNLERRISGDETRSTLCALYSRTEFLKACEQLGREIGKAPDRNQKYPEREAHFIQWQTLIDGKEATVSCSRTPQSALMPYDGTVLSVLIDHSGTAQKTAFKQPRVRTH